MTRQRLAGITRNRLPTATSAQALTFLFAKLPSAKWQDEINGETERNDHAQTQRCSSKRRVWGGHV